MNKTKTNKAKVSVLTLVLIGAGTTLAGCTTYTSFGQSVQHLVTEQTLDPLAYSADPAKSIRPIDGAKAAKVLQIHREDIAKPQEISNDIIVNIGN
ncbi:MAG: hypothetical protein ACR2P1_10200 [Pseudomonadales bacterium]